MLTVTGVAALKFVLVTLETVTLRFETSAQTPSVPV